MSVVIPILSNHVQDHPIGFVEFTDGAATVRFAPDLPIPVTKDVFYEIFGNVGMLLIDSSIVGTVEIIRAARILEWSFSPQPQRGGSRV